MVWTVKRCKPLLSDEIAQECQPLIEQKCRERGWHLLEVLIQPSQVKLKVQVWPTVAAEEVIQACKLATVHGLRQKFVSFGKNLPSLWTRSYLASVYEPTQTEL